MWKTHNFQPKKYVTLALVKHNNKAKKKKRRNKKKQKRKYKTLK